MGLTKQSTGANAADAGLIIERRSESERVVAIAGNPNVGKSTLFNGITGLNQHTGNWPGKTVTNAQGRCASEHNQYVLVDIPGAYSLLAHSAEEEVARNFLCFGGADAAVVVCDATCLERNLNLVLQTLEVTENVIVCVNLLDEAKRKGITIDLDGLKARLGVHVVGTVARNRKSLKGLMRALDELTEGKAAPAPKTVRYDAAIESAAAILERALTHFPLKGLSARFLALRLLAPDASLLKEAAAFLGRDLMREPLIIAARATALDMLKSAGVAEDEIEERIVSGLVARAEEIAAAVTNCERTTYNDFDRRLDGILTGRRAAYPLMFLLLALILFLTISGANVPSQWLSKGLFALEAPLNALLMRIGLPEKICLALTAGAYRVLAWVVAVMLPPMAIFFPLFTLLEDLGYLPRIAYNLDKPFQRCHACGKQALTMRVRHFRACKDGSGHAKDHRRKSIIKDRPRFDAAGLDALIVSILRFVFGSNGMLIRTD